MCPLGRDTTHATELATGTTSTDNWVFHNKYLASSRVHVLRVMDFNQPFDKCEANNII